MKLRILKIVSALVLLLTFPALAAAQITADPPSGNEARGACYVAVYYSGELYETKCFSGLSKDECSKRSFYTGVRGPGTWRRQFHPGHTCGKHKPTFPEIIDEFAEEPENPVVVEDPPLPECDISDPDLQAYWRPKPAVKALFENQLLDPAICIGTVRLLDGDGNYCRNKNSGEINEYLACCKAIKSDKNTLSCPSAIQCAREEPEPAGCAQWRGQLNREEE